MRSDAARACWARRPSRGLRRLLLALLATAGVPQAVALGAGTSTPSASERFQQANDAARSGDYPKATAAYRALADSGETSAALYWNWAHVAQAEGRRGESVWALLRARERDPGDGAVSRALERLREELNLDPSELAPDPLAQSRRWARWLHVDLLAAGLLLLSLAAHTLRRLTHLDRVSVASWTCFGCGSLLAALWIAGSQARPTAVVVRRDAALFDAAAPNAESIGALREGEVVPVLARSAGYLRIQDSAGGRGWARADEVTPLDDAP
jgi:hypothetical protein